MCANNNRFYEITCIDEILEIYQIIKKKDGTTYTLTKRKDDTGFYHKCDAIDIYGEHYFCRHKRMVVQKFYVNKKYRYLFNLSKRKKS